MIIGMLLKFRLSSSLKSIMKERIVVRRNIIDIEAAERDLRLKLCRKASFILLRVFMVMSLLLMI